MQVVRCTRARPCSPSFPPLIGYTRKEDTENDGQAIRIEIHEILNQSVSFLVSNIPCPVFGIGYNGIWWIIHGIVELCFFMNTPLHICQRIELQNIHDDKFISPLLVSDIKSARKGILHWGRRAYSDRPWYLLVPASRFPHNLPALQIE